MPDMLAEQCIDLGAIFLRRVFELKQGTNFAQRHVQ